MGNTKKTPYFYLGIITLILMCGMFIFRIANYNSQIEMYASSYGYDEAYVKELIPFWATVLPEFSDIFTSYGLMAVVSLGINCILNAIRNEKFVLKDFDITDINGDGVKDLSQVKETTEKILDKAEDKIEDAAEKLDELTEEIADKAEEFFNKED
ncbi:MAG: YtxH domain-containing protein [Eubacteriaceae bacterium]|nr:YtxH domain-containing protein [Eubacteriaceae bacterium]